MFEMCPKDFISFSEVFIFYQGSPLIEEFFKMYHIVFRISNLTVAKLRQSQKLFENLNTVTSLPFTSKLNNIG